MRRIDKKNNIKELNKKLLDEQVKNNNLDNGLSLLDNIKLINEDEGFNTKYLGDGNVNFKLVNGGDSFTISGKAEFKEPEGENTPPALIIKTEKGDLVVYHYHTEHKDIAKYNGEEHDVESADTQSRKWLSMLEIKHVEWFNSKKKTSGNDKATTFELNDGDVINGVAKYTYYGPQNIPVIKITVDGQTNPEYIFYREKDNNFILAGRSEGANVVNQNNWLEGLMKHYKVWRDKNENSHLDGELMTENTINLFNKVCGVKLIGGH